MNIIKKICAIFLCLIITLGTLPVFTVSAGTEPAYVSNQDFENVSSGSITFTDTSDDDNPATDKKEVSVETVKDAVGNDTNALQILRNAETYINTGNRIGVYATDIPNASVSEYFTEKIVHEYEFKMPNVDNVADSAFIAGFVFSGSGTGWHLYEISKNGIKFHSGDTVLYSQIGKGALNSNTWYKIKEVVDVNACTMSLYIDDLLLATQMITVSNLTVSGSKFSRSVFSLPTIQAANNKAGYKIYIDNIKVYPATTAEAEQLEITSIGNQIAKKAKIYLPAVSNKIYTDYRNDKGWPTTTTTSFTPNFSFTSSNTSVISNNGDWNVASPKGNQPDLNMTLTVKSGSTSSVYPITQKRETLDMVSGNTIEVGVPVAQQRDDDISKFAVESYVTSSVSKNATMFVSYYDVNGKLLKTFIKKANVGNGGTKLVVDKTAPVGAKTAKVYVWDDGLKPAISTYTVDIPEIITELSLPDDFGELETFTVTKKSSKVYTHDATPENQLGGQTVSVNISHTPTSTTGLGIDDDETISYKLFAKNCTSGLYDAYFTEDGKRRFILNIADPYYTDATSLEAKNLKADLIVRSTYKGADGISGTKDDGTWAAGFINEGSEPTAVEFQLVDGSTTTYMTTLSEAVQIARPMNPSVIDDNGIPTKTYMRAENLADCMATAGTFYQPYTPGADSNTSAEFKQEVYVHPYDDEDIADIKLTRYLRTDKSVLWVRQELGPYKIIFDNIKFGPFSHQFVPFSNEEDAKTSALMFFNCKFFGGENNSNALHITSPSLVNGEKVYTYNAYLFNCVAAYGGYDGFNYQGRNGNNCKVVEINCKSYNNGTMYFVPFVMNNNGSLNSDDGKNYSNNGTTSHYGMRILRVGGEYWNCQGGIVADVDSYSINIGCVARNRTATSGSDAAFMEHNDITDSEVFPVRPNYYIDCHAEGSGITNAFAAGSGESDVRCYDCTKSDSITNLTAVVPSTATGKITVGNDGWNTLVKKWQTE